MAALYPMRPAGSYTTPWDTIGTTSLDAVLAWAPAFGTRHFGITGTSPIALLGTFRAGGSLVGSIAGGILAQQSVTMRALVSSPQAAESNG
jgi:hypothetical protein